MNQSTVGGLAQEGGSGGKGSKVWVHHEYIHNTSKVKLYFTSQFIVVKIIPDWIVSFFTVKTNTLCLQDCAVSYSRKSDKANFQLIRFAQLATKKWKEKQINKLGTNLKNNNKHKLLSVRK